MAKDKRERTIPEELLEQWKKQKRHGDPAALVKYLKKECKLKVSRPTVDNALSYGAVHNQKLIDGINKFFEDRLKKELQTAETLNELGERVANLPPMSEAP
jgi:ribosomal protein L9